MEQIQPDAVRLSSGAELYLTQDDSMRPFVAPTDEARFQAAMTAMNPVQQSILLAQREAAMTYPASRVRRVQFPWVRESQA